MLLDYLMTQPKQNPAKYAYVRIFPTKDKALSQ